MVLVHVRDRYDRGTGNDGKIKIITLSHTYSQLLCPEKSRRKKEKGKKRRQCVKTLQGIPRKQSRWGWLEIGCTLPVTSCECERSASVIRRLDNYMRHCMTEERLTALALLHIHYDTHIDMEEVVNMFARMHPRRLEMDNTLPEIIYRGIGNPPTHAYTLYAMHADRAI